MPLYRSASSGTVVVQDFLKNTYFVSKIDSLLFVTRIPDLLSPELRFRSHNRPSAIIELFTFQVINISAYEVASWPPLIPRIPGTAILFLCALVCRLCHRSEAIMTDIWKDQGHCMQWDHTTQISRTSRWMQERFVPLIFHTHWMHFLRPPLWSGQTSWLQIQRPGFDSPRYQMLWEVLCLERCPLSLISATEELLERKSGDSGLENREYALTVRQPSVHKSWNQLHPQAAIARSVKFARGSGHWVYSVFCAFRNTGIFPVVPLWNMLYVRLFWSFELSNILTSEVYYCNNNLHRPILSAICTSTFCKLCKNLYSGM
jgi:hypothetical protein